MRYSPSGTRRLWNSRVYPRVYGGTRRSIGRSLESWGLSPRVRGNHPLVTIHDNVVRSIPACTGEPSNVFRLFTLVVVYPRVYGGTALTHAGTLKSQGLSPRVRGNHSRASPCRSARRSIPACTGEPSVSPLAIRLSRVYPRVYGEPSISSWVHQPAQVYPRVYGGTRLRSQRLLVCFGLSPRVRGNLITMNKIRRRKRSIPACTGEPWLRPLAPRLLAVYPRVYGGTSLDAYLGK